MDYELKNDGRESDWVEQELPDGTLLRLTRTKKKVRLLRHDFSSQKVLFSWYGALTDEELSLMFGTVLKMVDLYGTAPDSK